MRHALAIGRRGLGRVWPWPSVGCVIVKDGSVVGRGVSDQETRRHGEVVALAQAGGAAEGATVYVTLEPCAHHGTTPPCAEALVAAKVARVVAAMDDPNPQVAGKGFDILRAAGIAVETGLCEAEARDSHTGFLSVQERRRPMVTLKLASTLDGRIATASGESRWITGPQARRAVHLMRANHDAVLIGAGTARADDPTLTVRDLGVARQPVRVVASRYLRLPQESALARTARDVPLWIVCDAAALDTPEAEVWRAAGAELLTVEARSGQVSPQGLLEALAGRGITRVFCEGGGMLAASLLAEKCVDGHDRRPRALHRREGDRRRGTAVSRPAGAVGTGRGARLHPARDPRCRRRRAAALARYRLTIAKSRWTSPRRLCGGSLTRSQTACSGLSGMPVRGSK